MLRKVLFILFVVAIMLAGFLLGSTNQHLTELNLLVVKLSLRVIDVAVIFLMCGILLGLCFSSLYALQRKAKRRLNKSADNT